MRILAVVILVFLGACGRVATRRLFNPASIYCGAFAANALVQQLFVPSAKYSERVLLVIVSCGAATLLGTVTATLVPLGRVTPHRKQKFHLHRLMSQAYGAALVLMLVIEAFLYRQFGGVIAARVGPGGEYFDREIASRGLSGLARLGLRVGVSGLLLTAMLAAIIYGTRSWPRWATASGFVFVALGFAVATRARLASLIGLLVFFLGVAAWHTLVEVSNGRTRTRWHNHSMRWLALGAIVLGLTYVVYNVVAQQRYGGAASRTQFPLAIAGGTSGLSVAVADPDAVYVTGTMDRPGRGYSVAGWLDLLGIRPRRLGQFSGVQVLEGPEAARINIYSGLYHLRLDFGPMGTTLVLSAAAFVLERVARSLRQRLRVSYLCFVIAGAAAFAALPNMLLTYYNSWWLLILAPLALRSWVWVKTLAPAESDCVELHPASAVAALSGTGIGEIGPDATA